MAWVLLEAPDVRLLNGCLKTQMTRIELCERNSAYVHLPSIPDTLVNAILVSEDIGFFHHHGFDWHEIKQSFLKNLSSGEFKRGGSTISQQLVKNVFLNSDKTIRRKIKEFYLTVQLENNFSKKQILEKYLNVVELGPSVFGVKSASRYYFNVSIEQINLAQALYIAFLLPNPEGHGESYEKGRLTKYARKRMINLLEKMIAFKKITDQEFDITKKQLQNSENVF